MTLQMSSSGLLFLWPSYVTVSGIGDIGAPTVEPSCLAESGASMIVLAWVAGEEEAHGRQ